MSVAAPRPRVVNVDGVPMSALVAAVPHPRAVVLALHGGGTTSQYFDCPGHPPLSLLRTGAALGFTVIALDRPGYGSSALYPEAMAHPGQRVDLAYGAVERILGEQPRGAGLFVVAHSNGCELALRMATDGRRPRRSERVLGIELAGTGRHYCEPVHDILAAARLDHRPPGLRELLWYPPQLYPANVLTGITNASPGAPYEQTMVSDWPRHDFPALAAKVRVPVQFSYAEHEKVWRSDPPALAEIAAMFSASPRFVINRQLGAGHNLSLGHAAAAYHLKVFSFVEECLLARQHPAAVGLTTDVEDG
ncbi:alpha/beta fold hydrolase [Mycobacterium botniense]|uniref:Thioesterase n=1 Tax=Mycobacterium botniense TaxID=84962 RepID=A0A7I9XXP5_9MYCO|nr:alpha/beta fold hydrolase [Mycobacterium botniense]GFG74569.1 thioesterase [Mycobacterium botniense]